MLPIASSNSPTTAAIQSAAAIASHRRERPGLGHARHLSNPLPARIAIASDAGSPHRAGARKNENPGTGDQPAETRQVRPQAQEQSCDRQNCQKSDGRVASEFPRIAASTARNSGTSPT